MLPRKILLWIPSQIGISGNDRADQAAKEAVKEENLVDTGVSPQDFKSSIKNKLRLEWKNTWIQTVRYER